MNNKMKRVGPIAVYLSREQVNALLYLLDCFPAADSNSMFASDTKYIIICRAVPVGSHWRGWANTPCSCGSPSGIHNEIQEILSGERTADFIDETRRYAIANAFVKRIAMLKEIVQQHTNTDDLSDDLTENVAQTY